MTRRGSRSPVGPHIGQVAAPASPEQVPPRHSNIDTLSTEALAIASRPQLGNR